MLLDTHLLIWAMLAPDLLSGKARDALVAASQRCVSAASLYEISYKAMLGKWPEAERLLSVDLDAQLRSDGFEVVPASGPIMERAGRFDWAHRDPFDRIIVATALQRGMPVVSKDQTLDAIPSGGLQRIW
jgi:PIN domain nuclease of toxin-antitoxin system